MGPGVDTVEVTTLSTFVGRGVASAVAWTVACGLGSTRLFFWGIFETLGLGKLAALAGGVGAALFDNGAGAI